MNNKVIVCCSRQNIFLTLHSISKHKDFQVLIWSEIQSQICLLKLVGAMLRDSLVKPLVKLFPNAFGKTIHPLTAI